MKRKVLGITGTRSDYGLMRPVFQALTESESLQFELIVTGMHLLPEFESSLKSIRTDNLCKLHFVSMLLSEDSGRAMAQSLGLSVFGIANVMETERPDVLLLQGDRGEMLASAIVAAHMNIPIVHMSGGDCSGSIDDSIRHAISKFSHIHLTTCSLSSARLMAMGEAENRIFEVGEPGLDVIKGMQFIPADLLAKEFQLDWAKPVILATQHPVTTEADKSAWQMTQTLEALDELKMQTVFTYPNTDAGGRAMVKVLESYRDRDFIRIVPNLGSQTYLSLMRIASVMVGNSSSGILESPSFRLPAVNIGTRQHGRLRANNVIGVNHDKQEIKEAIRFALEDRGFRSALEDCKNPYGDGNAAGRTMKILQRLKLTAALLTKWMRSEESFLAPNTDAV